MLKVRTEGSPILLELSDWQTVTNENINKARVSYSCKWLSVHEKFHVQFARNKGDFFKVISWAHHGFKEILLSVWPFLELLLQIRILNVKFLLEFILRYIVSPILFFCPLKGLWASGYTGLVGIMMSSSSTRSLTASKVNIWLRKMIKVEKKFNSQNWQTF